MSPTKFQAGSNQQLGKKINGPRPSPLKINQDSIKKHHRQPVIIYAHSPEVIHTQARDFMALVQKLTGRDDLTNYQNQPQQHEQEEQQQQEQEEQEPALLKHVVRYDDNETATTSSSVTTDENSSCVGVNVMSSELTSVSGLDQKSTHNYLADIPMFTPGSTDLFSSPRMLFRYGSDSGYTSPAISPSLFEFMRGLPEY